ncbi:MAG TPA: anti-sigma factor antagonist [Sediminispirochaeta sp.]|nr:anti-sigma factor antagonist [Sediminispirochaeta sp.]
MTRGRYFFAEKNGITYIKMVGNLKYTFSSGFDQFVESLLERGFSNVVIDLSESDYIDSTNLGLIAKIAGRARGREDMHVSIVSPNEDINAILESVRFDKLFTIVDKVPEVDALDEIDDEQRGRQEDLRMLLDAHRALMDIDEENRPKFKDVVELLEKEVRDF